MCKYTWGRRKQIKKEKKWESKGTPRDCDKDVIGWELLCVPNRGSASALWQLNLSCNNMPSMGGIGALLKTFSAVSGGCGGKGIMSVLFY
jgi:hypothetical protein